MSRKELLCGVSLPACPHSIYPTGSNKCLRPAYARVSPPEARSPLPLSYSLGGWPWPSPSALESRIFAGWRILYCVLLGAFGSRPRGRTTVAPCSCTTFAASTAPLDFRRGFRRRRGRCVGSAGTALGRGPFAMLFQYGLLAASVRRCSVAPSVHWA